MSTYTRSRRRGERRRRATHLAVRGVGWLSVGVVELLMPRVIAQAAGMRGRERFVLRQGRAR